MCVGGLRFWWNIAPVSHPDPRPCPNYEGNNSLVRRVLVDVLMCVVVITLLHLFTNRSGLTVEFCLYLSTEKDTGRMRWPLQQPLCQFQREKYSNQLLNPACRYLSNSQTNLFDLVGL